MAAEIAFDLSLGHGRCVGVRIPPDPAGVDALAEALPGNERDRALAFPMPRRRTFAGGRTALHAALARLGEPVGPIDADDRGAPILPAGVVGSITHKERMAAALVDRVHAPGGARIGVDLEIDEARKHDLASRILRDDELAEIAGLAGDERQREVLLRFSAKEAIYKAIDPFVRRYVDFKEVALTPAPDGTARVVMHLREDEGPFAIEVSWRRFDGVVLTTARAQPTCSPARRSSATARAPGASSS
ncbi:MAG TPA: 4'-phosphopantetheinyl transferase superfamily protein [Polyangiaceae bacterium]|nr:4'-phosphopantetheinyl transferase superfamily protein [Polyangiaceae bacterium]